MEKEYNWVYNHTDKLVHAAKKKDKISICEVEIVNGITMAMWEMDAEKLKKLCLKCKDLTYVMKVLEF